MAEKVLCVTHAFNFRSPKHILKTPALSRHLHTFKVQLCLSVISTKLRMILMCFCPQDKQTLHLCVYHAVKKTKLCRLLLFIKDVMIVFKTVSSA